jgi:hypothetical protein
MVRGRFANKDIVSEFEKMMTIVEVINKPIIEKIRYLRADA